MTIHMNDQDGGFIPSSAPNTERKPRHIDLASLRGGSAWDHLPKSTKSANAPEITLYSSAAIAKKTMKVPYACRRKPGDQFDSNFSLIYGSSIHSSSSSMSSVSRLSLQQPKTSKLSLKDFDP